MSCVRRNLQLPIFFALLIVGASLTIRGIGGESELSGDSDSKISRCLSSADPEACLSRLLAENPNAAAFSARALYRASVGDLEGAESDLTDAIDVDPSDPHLLESRAAVRMRMGRTVEAEEDTRSASLLKREQFTDLGRLNEAIDADPSDAENFRKRSLILQEQGDIAGALRDARVFVSLMDGAVAPSVYYFVASLSSSLGDSQGAIEALSLGVKRIDEVIKDPTERANARARFISFRASQRRLTGDIAGALHDEAELEATKTRNRGIQN